MQDIIERDLKYIWHPCSQMKDYETLKPLIVNKAYGSYIELTNKRRVIDAISSWWCKILGHNHPRLKAALFKQASRFEHVIFANTTNDIIVELSEKLNKMTSMDKVLYASDGSSAVEMAIKMSVHARKINGENHRTKIMSLENSYHGETALTMSLSNIEIYRQPYAELLTGAAVLHHLPYVHATSDLIWHNCDSYWPKIEKQLEKFASKLTAIIVESIVQGAGGMLIYSQNFLTCLRRWTTKYNIHLIVDEIMTGFGRTGAIFAYQHANIKPDFICLAKGLTGGWLPMSALLTTNQIYQLFYDHFESNKSFLHSHTHSGNALAAAVALECIKTLDEEDVYANIKEIESLLFELMFDVAKQTRRLNNIRSIGAIVAADLKLTKKQQTQRYGYQVFQNAIKRGAFLRPLGNTIYWLPPLNISKRLLIRLKDITKLAILDTFK